MNDNNATNNNGNTPSSSITVSRSPHLDSLLSKLRPFQRSAFEFAVYDEEDGSASRLPRKRDDDDDDADDDDDYARLRGKRRNEKKNISGCRGDSGSVIHKQVAGAGTGRILLGDEMGLG